MSWISNGLTSLLTELDAVILVNGYPLRDTNVHNYRTDPNYFSIRQIIGRIRIYGSFGVWVYNNTNQTVSVQLIGNVSNDQAYPDYTIGSPQSVSPGNTALITFSITDVTTPFLGVQISASTAPTSGYVSAVLVIG